MQPPLQAAGNRDSFLLSMALAVGLTPQLLPAIIVSGEPPKRMFYRLLDRAPSIAA